MNAAMMMALWKCVNDSKIVSVINKILVTTATDFMMLT